MNATRSLKAASALVEAGNAAINQLSLRMNQASAEETAMNPQKSALDFVRKRTWKKWSTYYHELAISLLGISRRMEVVSREMGEEPDA
jgi:hypothetical protein